MVRTKLKVFSDKGKVHPYTLRNKKVPPITKKTPANHSGIVC